MIEPKPKFILQLSATLLIALALKTHYSFASVNELRWILAPTTFLVELVTGMSFAFESHAGYMSSDNTFLIAATCSGVNFLIISFLLLTLGPLWRERRIEWKLLPLAMATAYVATLVANTTRIVIALSLRDVELSWLSADSIHRLEGIVVYLGFLLLLFVWKEKRGSLVLPIAIYYGVTLGIPIVRGEFVKPEFWGHSVVVLVVPIVVVGLLSIVRRRNGGLSPTATNL